MKIIFKLGDLRLIDRAKSSIQSFINHYSRPLSQVFQCYNDLQGFYRFMWNEKITKENLFESILESTISEVSELDEIAILHDTTTINPKLNKKSKILGQKGIYTHLSLAVSTADIPHIYGPANIEMWQRDKNDRKKSEESEHLRWMGSVANIEKKIPKKQVIHIMDREGDSMLNLREFFNNDRRFIVRLSFNRAIKDPQYRNILNKIRDQKSIVSITGKISKREESVFKKTNQIHPKRKARDITLDICSCNIAINKKRRHSNIRDIVNCNIVRVWEKKPPEAEEAIEWILITSEEIDSPEKALKVVKLYRRRWLIEEFFKGLKTGCKIEEKQFESAEIWEKFIIFLLPVAVTILNLKELSHFKLFEIKQVLNSTQLEILIILGKKNKFSMDKPVDFVYQLANLGGHIKYNGPPGWITLIRGFQELVLLEKGWLLRCNI